MMRNTQELGPSVYTDKGVDITIPGIQSDIMFLFIITTELIAN